MHDFKIELLNWGEPVAVAQYNSPSEKAIIIKRWKQLYGSAKAIESNMRITVLREKILKVNDKIVEHPVLNQKSNFKKGKLYKQYKPKTFKTQGNVHLAGAFRI